MSAPMAEAHRGRKREGKKDTKLQRKLSVVTAGLWTAATARVRRKKNSEKSSALYR